MDLIGVLWFILCALSVQFSCITLLSQHKRKACLLLGGLSIVQFVFEAVHRQGWKHQQPEQPGVTGVEGLNSQRFSWRCARNISKYWHEFLKWDNLLFLSDQIGRTTTQNYGFSFQRQNITSSEQQTCVSAKCHLCVGLGVSTLFQNWRGLGFGLQLALNFLYFQRPQYSIRKLGNFWIIKKTFRCEMISHGCLGARKSKPSVIGEQSGWCNELPQGMGLRHELAVLAEPFAAGSCWCVAKQAHWSQHLLGELCGKWLFWQNEMVVHLCDVLSSKLTPKIPNCVSWGCWNTTRWAGGIISAMAFHCLYCYFGELLCERVHFSNKKKFLQNWAPRIKA